MFNILSILLASLCLVNGADPNPDLVVETLSGKVQGWTRKTINNLEYYAYQGIPFAEPPVGQLRFQAPKAIAPWDDTKGVETIDKICYQYDSDSSTETEDCLYINVFTPVKPGQELNQSLPVLFTIYGGAFKDGSSAVTYPRAFIENDIIVATVQYRVGIFGFLSTMDETISGNWGLKDQHLGLKWVYDNIQFFGGDNQRITINGQSAGSSSVTYHYLSPKSNDYFRAGIGESGSAFCNTAHSRSPIEAAYGVGNLLNSSISQNSTTSLELLQFLRTASAKDLDAAAKKQPEWAPTVEVEHEDAFITENMYEAVEQGKFNRKPLFIGINSEEQIGRAANPDSFKESMKYYDEDVRRLVNPDFNLESDDPILEELGQEIRTLYTDGLMQDDLGASVRYFSDNMYSRAITKFAKMFSEWSDCYYYVFYYHGELGGNNVQVDGADRVGHSEERSYIWLADNLDFGKYPASDKATSDRFVYLFVQMIRHMNPTAESNELIQNITWPLVNATNYQYLHIDTDLTIQLNPKEKVFSKWEQLYEKYGKRPFTTF